MKRLVIQSAATALCLLTSLGIGFAEGAISPIDLLADASSLDGEIVSVGECVFGMASPVSVTCFPSSYDTSVFLLVDTSAWASSDRRRALTDCGGISLLPPAKCRASISGMVENSLGMPAIVGGTVKWQQDQ